MEINDLELATDLRRKDLDPESFAAALAVQHINRLLTNGGSRYGLPGDEEVFHQNILNTLFLML